MDKIELYKNDFKQIVSLIQQSRKNVIRAINTELINLYWEIGKYISLKIKSNNWGAAVVENLSEYIRQTEANTKGFSSQNLWRMKQFYESYSENEKLSPLVREIGWTNNMIILAQSKTDEEREFYLKLCKQENLTKKELLRQLNTSLYERTMLSKENLSPLAREKFPEIKNYIRDYYSLEFLGLEENYTEKKFQNAILRNLKVFILEFGKDFLFVGQEYRIQIGKQDYFIDLLFLHRELNCLVAIELKVGEFKPEYMGKMDFYLGALDKYVKKKHENPSIGIILCKTKEDNIVEISLNRSTSPTAVSEYETKLIDKEMLRLKLNEIFEE